MARIRQQSKDATVTEKKKQDSAGTGTLVRGLAIMDLLLRAHQPMTLAEIADALHLDHSTVLRLLRSLEELRQVIRVGKGRKYICSPKALRPLPLLHPLEQLRRDSASMLFTFAAEVKTTAVLVVYLGIERLVAQVATSSGTLNPYYNAWLDGPLHGSGPGKALLMSLDRETRRELVGQEPFHAFTPHTIQTWDALDADLTAAEDRGYALVRDEFYLGLSAMSANIRSSNGNIVGCVALTGHTRDFTPEWIQATSAKLLNLTKLIPMQIGSLTMIDTLCGR